MANKNLGQVVEKSELPLNKPVVTLESTVGDMDGNKVVDVADALSICRQLLENGTIDYRKQSDANGDGRIDVGDALHIINKSLKEQG